ncbi:MAG: hypothetical protein ACI4SC_03830 [Candidatus Neoclostridium sp.]
MYCKYCGKKLDGNMEVCPECEEKISNGENPFFSVPTYRDPVKELKNEVALREQNADASGANQVAENTAETTVAPGGEPAANPTTVAPNGDPTVNPTAATPNGEPTVNPTAAAPAKPASAYRSGGSEDWHYGSKFAKTYNGVGYGGYTRTSGLVFGILSVALPWACLITSLISVSVFVVFFQNPAVSAVSIVLTFLAGIIVSLVFGIKAIVEFKRAKRSGVAPVPTLVLGIVGLAQIATFLLLVTDVFPFDTIL